MKEGIFEGSSSEQIRTPEEFVEEMLIPELSETGAVFDQLTTEFALFEIREERDAS